jgi:hypothetical protein
MTRKAPRPTFQLRILCVGNTITINAFEGERDNNLRRTYKIQVLQRVAAHMLQKEIFPTGQLYCAVHTDKPAGVRAKEIVMATVAMRPGDTDAEYFSGYSEEQKAWARVYSDLLNEERLTRYCDHRGEPLEIYPPLK